MSFSFVPTPKPNSIFLSVEDPSEDFVRLRDFVDVVNALELVKAFADPDIVKAGFSEDMVKVGTILAK